MHFECEFRLILELLNSLVLEQKWALVFAFDFREEKSTLKVLSVIVLDERLNSAP